MKHKGHHVRCRPVRASLLRCKMLSFDLSIHVMHQFSPTLGLGHAARTGEASNPGPGRNQSTCLINIAIANPTSIVSRRQTFADILANENLQILCLAETSATLAVQKRVQKDMGTLQCKSFWSNPVTPMRTCQDGNNSLRGRTGGTAVFAKTPMRMCRNPLPNEWMSTTRLVHTIAQIGQTNFQLITLYSIPQSHANAKEYFNNLLHVALQQPYLCHFVICGDFNMEPRKYPCGTNSNSWAARTSYPCKGQSTDKKCLRLVWGRPDPTMPSSVTT